jgi:superfamily I DNA/RNA helicase/mRNA-degrading endonuclease RelE of RelBE toxin-antitoxin system
MTQPQVAFSKEFMEAYSALPRKIQKKVREFTEKFQQDPTQPGLNFERLEAARDPKVRSARIDQAYRAIVIHPPKGDVYLCVWVGHHDDAYAWARDRRFEVNPRSGTFQIFAVEEETNAEAATPALQADAPPIGLFEKHDDEDLLLGGVPEPLLASIRAIEDEAGLDALAPLLPSDTAELLYLLAAGYDLMEAIEESDRSKPKPVQVDTEDFEAAFARPESQQSIRVVADEADLDAMLNAPLEQWRVFLHPSQRKLVQMNANGPVRVLGGAGTGKTVVLMHRANHLASRVFPSENDRILITTFTRNLALDLRMNLRNLCDPQIFSRLEVTNIHSWVAGFLRKQGHGIRIVNEHERRHLFDMALAEVGDYSRQPDFYVDEWDSVVQGQEVRSRDEYFTARRVGRGTRLTRRQRAEVWTVFERYRELLESEGWLEWSDAVREARLYIQKQNIVLPYKAVLCDEVQDLSGTELLLLRALAPDIPNSLFLVGDGHQRIYGQPARLSTYGIEIRGRSRRLKLNYRTTQEIRDRAVSVLENCEIDDLDGGLDSLKGYRSLRAGVDPKLEHFNTEAAEAEYVARVVKDWIDSGVSPQAICVAARTQSLLADRYTAILNSAGVETVAVKKDPEAELEQPGVRLATLHRMKGLEFSRVLLVGVQEGTVPLRIDAAQEELAGVGHELKERCLLYVAMTRARDELVVSGYGGVCQFL